MTDTGRINKSISPALRAMLFGENADASIDRELSHICRVDRAHLLMLTDAGVVARGPVIALLDVIAELRDTGFAPLRGRPAPRGIYLLYESHLIERLGADIGGILQTGRSRNDLNATTLRLRLRDPYLRLLREALRLQAILIRRATRFGALVMPAYTHSQVAVPVTLGHYLSGVANALRRDIEGLLEAGGDLDRCPLGAGAVGGTSVPIRPQITTSLLGFDRPVDHSIDAVASRDLVFRMLAAASILGVTLSRAATDLFTWSTSEFGFLTYPDHLVGSSSMMPQKRNPYILEHVQGRSAAPLGAFVSALSSAHAKPFTNTIAVGTEAVAHAWDALRKVTEATTLLRVMIAGMEPNPAAMRQRVVDGFAGATEAATRLALNGNMSFRSAHYLVGSAITEMMERGERDLQAFVSAGLGQEHAGLDTGALDPDSLVRAAEHGGGPGPGSHAAMVTELREGWRLQCGRVARIGHAWRSADERLDQAERALRDLGDQATTP